MVEPRPKDDAKKPWNVPWKFSPSSPDSDWNCEEFGRKKSMDWFEGKSTGNHKISHEIWCFPVNFPLNQAIELWGKLQIDQEAPEDQCHRHQLHHQQRRYLVTLVQSPALWLWHLVLVAEFSSLACSYNFNASSMFLVNPHFNYCSLTIS